MSNNPQAPKGIADILKEQATAAAPATATAASQITAGMANSGVGANVVVDKPQTAKVSADYTSVHVSTIQGVKGISSKGRFCWSKDSLKADEPRLKALLKAGRVSKNF